MTPSMKTSFPTPGAAIHPKPSPSHLRASQTLRTVSAETDRPKGCEKYCGFRLMTSRCNCTMRYFLRGTVLNQLRPPYPICDINDDAQIAAEQLLEARRYGSSYLTAVTTDWELRLALQDEWAAMPQLQLIDTLAFLAWARHFCETCLQQSGDHIY
ncbi:hypothetical protein TNCV_1584171 [Trichonephila clavipes]|nr:hypothetical protein TNCV_1584171 [Trichonephila clavipes]